MNIPATEPVYTTCYTGFKGVDFTSQLCSPNRFPKGKNFIITDMVEKRPGYKLLNRFEGKINGLYNAIINGVKYYIIHEGSNLHSMTSFEDESVLLLQGILNSSSDGFYCNGYFYILTGQEYIRTDGKTAQIINENTYSNPFYIEAVDTSYKSESTYISIRYTERFEETNYYENLMLRFYNEGFNQNSLTGYACVSYTSFNNVVDSEGATVILKGYLLPPNAKYGKAYIEFDGGYSEKFDITREYVGSQTADGKYIYYVQTPKTSENYKYVGKPFKIYYPVDVTDRKIYTCKTSTFIQYGNGMYFFFTGNSEEPNMDWQSELNNPAYFPSDNYSIYGTEDEILGYGQYGENVVIFKKGSGDNNIYIKSALEIEGLGVTFPTSVCVGGAIGGVSRRTIKNLNGETLYLTNEGIYALTSLSTTNMKVTRNRSYFVDGKLLKETGLENAVSCVWKNKYILSVNGNCYILDGGQPLSYREGSNNDYVYECLYWDNINATAFMVEGELLYFGTQDGSIYLFDENIYTDEGTGVECIVATKLDDDGDFMAYKKMKKKGTGLLVKPYKRSTFDISFLYDDYESVFVKSVYADIFDFNDIDFDRFTYETSENPRVIPFLKKSKKYKSIQIIIRSNNDEPFGFMSIIKRYTFNNFVKRS